MALTVVLFIVFFICLAMMWNEGMWSNAVTVVNVTFAAMVATNYFEPIADWLDGQLPSYTYLWDYLSLWALFVVSFLLLRYITDTLSRHRVRFRMPVEHTGRVLFAAWTGWVIICFTCFTLHTAPLAQSPFRGSFQSQPQSNNFLGMAPGRMWMGFMQTRSEEALSRAQPQVFDPQGEFVLKYGARRAKLQQHNESTGSILVRRR